MGNYQEYLFFYSAATKKEENLVCSHHSLTLNAAKGYLGQQKSRLTKQILSLLTNCWDYLKHILNQEQFYLL